MSHRRGGYSDRCFECDWDWPCPSAQVVELQTRIAVLERRQAVADHQHHYRYSKHLTDGSPFWSWKCLDDDGEASRICPQSSGGTNHLGGLPDHFPAALR